MTRLRENDPEVQALLAEAEAHELLAKAARLRAGAAVTTRQDDDEVLDVDRTLAEFGVGKDALKAAAKRGEISLVRGARNQIMATRGELRRWQERAYTYKSKPRERALTLCKPEDDRTIENMVREGRLVVRSAK
jgi:hypothetical protein